MASPSSHPAQTHCTNFPAKEQLGLWLLLDAGCLVW